MDFFNTIFENADAKDAINDIVDIISEYDVFDIIDDFENCCRIWLLVNSL